MNTFRTHALTLAAVAALAGCAAAPPLLPVHGFGEKPAVDPDPRTLEEARAVLLHLRADYNALIVDQQTVSNHLTGGLFVLGAAVTGMAAGDVHRDAILGASLVGGTAYGLGRMGLDARRIKILSEGIKALDCSDEATAPLLMNADDVKALHSGLQTLPVLIAKVEAAQQRLRRPPTGATAPAPAMAAANAAEATLQQARQTHRAARALVRQRDGLGPRLVFTARAIDRQVRDALNDIRVDITGLPNLLAGFTSMAGMFAPGVQAHLDEKMSGIQLQPHGGADGAAALTADETALATALAELVKAEAQVADLLRTVDTDAIVAALKGCGVAGAAYPLVLTPATLSFQPGQADARSVEVTGGTPPYKVTFLDAAPDGLSVVGQGHVDTVVVKATAALKAIGSFQLQVSDSAASRQSKPLVVHVGTTGAKTPSADERLDTLAAKLKGRQAEQPAGQTFTITDATASAGTLNLTVACTPTPAKPPTAIELKGLLVALEPGLANLLKTDGTPDLNRVTLLPAGSKCFKA